VADIREKVSGIGSMSERTDLNVSKQPARYISGLPQGQGQATYDQQTAAPMAATPQVEAMGIGALDITPITAESKRPDENILTGASFVPGTDTALLNLPYQQPTVLTTLGKIAQNDPTGDTELFMMMFQNRGLG
jgi:hypothetical protein